MQDSGRIVQRFLRSEILIKSIDDLKCFGIEYKAPYDASRTDLTENSIDSCISTNTLEHIPKESIVRIFKEMHRILNCTGIVSAKIDYSDHYSHTDPSITRLNYLNFSENQWNKYNHRCHYQNRLRHDDYRSIFVDCGFQIIQEELFFDEENISNDLWEKYKNAGPNWHATAAYFLLKKKH